MPLAELSLSLPGVGRPMRLARRGEVTPRFLEASPLVVTSDGRPSIAYDATALAEAFGPAWAEVEGLFGAVAPGTVHAELRTLAAEGALPAELVGPLGEAEVGVLEGDPAAVAALVLVLLHAKIHAVVTARAPGDAGETPAP